MCEYAGQQLTACEYNSIAGSQLTTCEYAGQQLTACEYDSIAGSQLTMCEYAGQQLTACEYDARVRRPSQFVCRFTHRIIVG